MIHRTKKRAINPAERDSYLRDALGLVKVIQNGRELWIKADLKGRPKLQYSAGVPLEK